VRKNQTISTEKPSLFELLRAEHARMQEDAGVVFSAMLAVARRTSTTASSGNAPKQVQRQAQTAKCGIAQEAG
jgi:hypothetical protein